MKTPLQRALFPCALVLLSAVLCVLVYWRPPQRFSFEALVDEIATAEDPTPLLARAETFITFQARHLQPSRQTRSAMGIADLYFRLGDALYRREDARVLAQTLFYYHKALEWYAPIRHGWAFYQIGAVLEHLGAWEQAYAAYDDVAAYDFGFLALRAGFRKAWIAQNQGKAVDWQAVYRYLRFYGPSAEVARVVRDWGETSMPLLPECYYILAKLWVTQDLAIPDEVALTPELLFSPIQDLRRRFPRGDAARVGHDGPRLAWALEALYHERYPNDPLGWRRVVGEGELDLLQSYFAPRAIQNGGVILLDEEHLLAELPVGTEAASIRVVAEIENPAPHPKSVCFGLGPEGRGLRRVGIDPGGAVVELELQPIVPGDILDVYVADVDPLGQASSNWIKIRSLRANAGGEKRD